MHRLVTEEATKTCTPAYLQVSSSRSLRRRHDRFDYSVLALWVAFLADLRPDYQREKIGMQRCEIL